MRPYLFPAARPGQLVRWRHPRRACALGLFDWLGPGPFEVVAVAERAGGLRLLVQAETGLKDVPSAWLGPADCSPREPA
jgi:hypothetical protein